MSKYILRRILIFIPTIFIITILAFIISVNAPGDPVARMMSSSQTGEQFAKSQHTQEIQFFWRKKLGLDLPVFYISIHSLAVPDTLYKIYNMTEREALERLVDKYGNWEKISSWHLSLLKLEKSIDKKFSGKSPLATDKVKELYYEILSLKYAHNDQVIQSKLNSILKWEGIESFIPEINEVKFCYGDIKNNKTQWKNFIPEISFHLNNQYHRWLFGDGEYSKGILRGDFGISYVTKQPVSQVIGEKISWSLFFTVVSVFLAYLVSIPVGAKAGAKKDSAFDKVSSVVLFILYSLPAFWVATLLLMTFANPDALLIFPASGVKPAFGYPENASLFLKLKLSLPYLILPTICYAYSSFSFLSRTMRVSMLEEINRDYVRAARAKGLSESKVIYKHALRNALFPAITVFANVFPFAIGGSVILETIFTIPGMGYETFIAIQNQNYPMIITVFTITGVLTLIGFLVSDILYAVADPRISYST